MIDRPDVQNLGTRTGRLLVFGGPYSNVQALETLKSIAEQLRIPANNIICTGDIVGVLRPARGIGAVRQRMGHPRDSGQRRAEHYPG